MSEDIEATGASAFATTYMSDRMSSRIAVVGGRCHFLNVTPRCSNVLTRYDAGMYSKHRKLKPTLASDGAASGFAARLRIPGSSRAVFRFDRAQHSDVISRSIPI